MRYTQYSILPLVVLLLIGCNSTTQRTRVVEDFNNGWSFTLAENIEPAAPNCDDASWRKVNLPHDWSIEFDFNESAPATPGGGALDGGTGWYSKCFTLENDDSHKQIFIDFDGVYWNSTVWVNGTEVGFRPNGYISFRYDITDFLKFDSENTIIVKVDNSKQPNSRWYSGSGIYRNVRLTKTDKIHVGQWGTYVTTENISSKSATVNIKTTVENSSNKDEQVTLISTIVDNKGKDITSQKSIQDIAAGQNAEFTQSAIVSNPTLWSDKNPYMYSVRSEVEVGGKIVDDYTTPLGIRYFEFNSERGFLLNGVPTKILGVCQHHDLGALGAAVNYRALERQLEILKEMGCNSIRTSHNPPAPELIELCDKMGFIVQSEMFDMWRKQKSQHDYAQFFTDWHEKDLTDFILRDRNHPSIMMWSIGNEILEQWLDIKVDTLDLQQANLLFNFAKNMTKAEQSDSMHVNSLLALKLANIVRELDPTRPITSGNNEARPSNFLFRSGAMDIIGINYNENAWAELPKNFPNKGYIITESTSSLMSRGYYEMPSDKINTRPDRWDIPYFKEGNECSSYDNSHAPWGTTHEKSWQFTKRHDFLAGLYVWTGFDYLGEPTPFWWPSRSSYFGIVDLAGFPKDVYYMYQSEWTDKDVLHIFPHWNHAEGDTVDIWAYYNNADEVELFLNDVSLGKKSKTGEELHVWWRVPYQKGTLRAESRKNGKTVLSKEIKTAEKPLKIRLTADRASIKADGKDISFVTVEVMDENGVAHPTADNFIEFSTTGTGFITGTDNGCPIDHLSLSKPQRKLYNGKAIALVRSNEEKGKVTLTAKSAGFEDATITINCK